MELSREDMMAAVTEGVRLAMAARLGVLQREAIYEAVHAGVHDAMWKMITNATMAPCADFYDTVKEGVAEAMARVATP